MTLKHLHLILQAEVKTKLTEKELEEFLFSLVREIDMKVLILPQLKFSHQKAWTGMIGIITSHITFHYWTIEKYLQLDIYSCKEFDIENAVKFIKDFWKTNNEKIIFLKRNHDEEFRLRKIFPEFIL
jgi:S-adenosylmethionine/arginine decarboxylase-like enzyme